MRVKYIIAVSVLTLGLSSCVVSKKKYETLENAKFASDQKVRSLLKEKSQFEQTIDENRATITGLNRNLNSLKEEFNNFKYDMSASNAQKSSQIDKLTSKLGSTIKDREDIKEKSQELEGDLNWLRKERQRNTERISEMEATIKELNSKINTLNSEKTAALNLKKSSQEKISQLTEEVAILKIRLEREQNLNIKLQQELKAHPQQKENEPIPEI